MLAGLPRVRCFAGGCTPLAEADTTLLCIPQRGFAKADFELTQLGGCGEGGGGVPVGKGRDALPSLSPSASLWHNAPDH